MTSIDSQCEEIVSFWFPLLWEACSLYLLVKSLASIFSYSVSPVDLPQIQDCDSALQKSHFPAQSNRTLVIQINQLLSLRRTAKLMFDAYASVSCNMLESQLNLIVHHAWWALDCLFYCSDRLRINLRFISLALNIYASEVCKKR